MSPLRVTAPAPKCHRIDAPSLLAGSPVAAYVLPPRSPPPPRRARGSPPLPCRQAPRWLRTFRPPPPPPPPPKRGGGGEEGVSGAGPTSGPSGLGGREGGPFPVTQVFPPTGLTKRQVP